MSEGGAETWISSLASMYWTVSWSLLKTLPSGFFDDDLLPQSMRISSAGLKPVAGPTAAVTVDTSRPERKRRIARRRHMESFGEKSKMGIVHVFDFFLIFIPPRRWGRRERRERGMRKNKDKKE